MRKILLVLGGTVVFAGAFAGTAFASTTSAASCVQASAATYKHAFDGPAGTATITATAPLCGGERQAFTLVSYTAPSKSFGNPQFVYATDTATVTSSKPAVTLKVDVPGCYTQVDTIFGTSVINPIVDGGPRYGNTKAGEAAAPGNRSAGVRAWYNGGSTTCAPKPSVSFTSACDGALTAHLANGAGANVDAVFALDGRLVRVAPGKTATVPVHAAKLTVRDNTFTSVTGSFAKPSDCHPASPSTSAAPSVSPSKPVSASPAASVSPSKPASASPSAPVSHPATASSPAAPPASASPSAPWTNHPVETVTEITPSNGTGNGNGVVVLPTTSGPAASAGLPVTGTNAAVLAGAALFMIGFGGGLIMLGRRVRQGRHTA